MRSPKATIWFVLITEQARPCYSLGTSTTTNTKQLHCPDGITLHYRNNNSLMTHFRRRTGKQESNHTRNFYCHIRI